MEPTASTSQKSARRGCLFYGCLTLVIVGLGLVALFGVGIYLSVQEVKKLTSTDPVPVPAYNVKPGEVEAIDKKVREFEQAAAGAPARLELSAADLNALLASRGGEGKAFVRIEGQLVHLDGSFRFPDLPWPASALAGRYLNGSIGLRPTNENQRLVIRPETAMADGKPVPDKVLTLIKSIEIFDLPGAEGLKQIEGLGKQLKSVRVEGDRLILER
jgi:hypothetical protein